MDAGLGDEAAPARSLTRPRPAPLAQEHSGLTGDAPPPRRMTRRSSADLLSEASGAAALTLSFLGSPKESRLQASGSPPGSYRNSGALSYACSQNQEASDAEVSLSLQASRRMSQGNALSRKGTITGHSSGGLLSKQLSRSQGSDTLPSPPRELRTRKSSSLQDRDVNNAIEHMRNQGHIAHQLEQQSFPHFNSDVAASDGNRLRFIPLNREAQEGDDSGSWSCSQEPHVTASGSAATPSDMASSPCYSPLASRNSGGPLRPTLASSCAPSSTGDRSSGLTSRLSNSSKLGPGSDQPTGLCSAGSTHAQQAAVLQGERSSSAMHAHLQQAVLQGDTRGSSATTTGCQRQQAVLQGDTRGSSATTTGCQRQQAVLQGDTRGSSAMASRLSLSGRLLNPAHDTQRAHAGAPHAAPVRASTQDELPSQHAQHTQQTQQAQHAQHAQQMQQAQQQLPQVSAPAVRPPPLPSSDPLSSSLFGDLPLLGIEQWHGAGGVGSGASVGGSVGTGGAGGVSWRTGSFRKPALGSGSPQSPKEDSTQQGTHARRDVQLPSIFAAHSYQLNRPSLGDDNELASAKASSGGTDKHLNSAPDRSWARTSQEHLAPLAPNGSSQSVHVQQHGHQASPSAAGPSKPSPEGTHSSRERLMAERHEYRGRKSSCELQAATRSRRASQESAIQQQRPVSPQMSCGRESSLIDGVATLFGLGKKKRVTESEEPSPEPSIGNIFSGLLSRLRLPAHASSKDADSPSCSLGRSRRSSVSSSCSDIKATGDEDSSDLRLQQEPSQGVHDRQVRMSSVFLQQEPSCPMQETLQQDHHRQAVQPQQPHQQLLQQRASAPPNSLVPGGKHNKQVTVTDPKPKNVLAESVNLLAGELGGEGSKVVRRTASTTQAAHSSEGATREHGASVMSGRTMRRSIAMEGEAAARHKSFMYKRSLSNYADPTQPARGKSFVDTAMPQTLRGLALQQLEQRKGKPGR